MVIGALIGYFQKVSQTIQLVLQEAKINSFTMERILLLSDTHGYMDENILKYVKTVDQVWHAGDIGDFNVTRAIEEIRPLKSVYGNIDDYKIRATYPEHQRFSLEGLDIWITHIGGYPGRYDRRVKPEIFNNTPDIFISGHSHILKVMRDQELNLMHLNPGAIGKHGLHKVRTMLRFNLDKGEIKDMEVIEFKR